jgi:hypothetical protein
MFSGGYPLESAHVMASVSTRFWTAAWSSAVQRIDIMDFSPTRFEGRLSQLTVLIDTREVASIAAAESLLPENAMPLRCQFCRSMAHPWVFGSTRLDGYLFEFSGFLIGELQSARVLTVVIHRNHIYLADAIKTRHMFHDLVYDSKPSWHIYLKRRQPQHSERNKCLRLHFGSTERFQPSGSGFRCRVDSVFFGVAEIRRLK